MKLATYLSKLQKSGIMIQQNIFIGMSLISICLNFTNNNSTELIDHSKNKIIHISYMAVTKNSYFSKK
jgi:hypothetical protein